jgi:hypothetical protein
MTGRSIAVDAFPGRLILVTEDSPAAARDVARATPVPHGWITSRSYRGRYGLVAAAPVRVGVDIERLDDAVTADAVLTPLEAGRSGGPNDWCSWWSAKEALAKALGDARAYVGHRLESPALWPCARAGRWRAERLPVPDGFVGWVVWEADGAPVAELHGAAAPVAAFLRRLVSPRVDESST